MGNVSQIKQKLHSDRLSGAYPRVDRENKQFNQKYITDEMAPFCPPQSPNSICAVVKDNPFDGHTMVYEIDLKSAIPYFNSVLMYRVLKLLYGQPDILGVILGISSEKNPDGVIEVVLDWGYTVRIHKDLFAELRSIHNNNRFKLRYWIGESPQDLAQEKVYQEKMVEFLQAFADCIEKNTHLFEEREEIGEKNISWSAFENVFAERYRAASEILDEARSAEELSERKDITWNEKLLVCTNGSLYLSSAIFFIMALEALINTIYHLLLKQEFRHEVYERATIRADLDVRIISTHLFCDGFVKPILIPNTDLWNRVLKLRRFRNDVIHGNITSDQYMYFLQEDDIDFFYCGITNFPGRKAKNKADKNYPTTMAQVNLNVVSEIKDTVDQVVQAITDAVDQKNRMWMKGWLWEAVIPKFNTSEAPIEADDIVLAKEPLK